MGFGVWGLGFRVRGSNSGGVEEGGQPVLSCLITCQPSSVLWLWVLRQAIEDSQQKKRCPSHRAGRAVRAVILKVP